MGSRQVKVALIAEVGNYVTGMKNAAAATKDLTTSTLDTAAKNKQAMTQLGLGVAAMGTVAAAGVAMAVSRFADFDAAMSGVQAATHESAAAMDELKEAALEAGARTAFSATEAADGIEQLAKAGVATSDILNGGLNGALDLAAAGGLDVGQAAEIAATAMTQFGLAGSKVPHIADLLAAAAGKAQGDVTDMGMALKQAGLVAGQTGLTIEETTAGLASFASAGLLGSDAGTSFKSMLQRLTPQSEEAANKMAELGISAYDAQGNFIGLEAFAGNLQESLAGLTVEQRNSAMATIFGSDAVRAASVLYSQGAEGIAAWTEKVNDAGYAQETASIKLDNLKGDVEAFLGSFETALIETGEAGDGFARSTVQAATSVVNAYNDLPKAAQSTFLGFGALTAVVGAAAGGLLVLAPRIAETRDAMRTLRTEMPRTSGALRVLGKTFGALMAAQVVATGFAALGRAFDDAAPSADKLTTSLLQLTDAGASGELARAFGDDLDNLGASIRRLTDKSNQEQFVDWGNTVFTLGQRAGDNTMIEAAGKLDALDQALSGLVTSGNADVAQEKFDALAAKAQAGGASVEEFRQTLPGYSDALARAGNDATLAAGAQDKLGGAVAGASGEVVEQTASLEELMEALQETTGMVLGLRDASRGYEAAVDAAAEAVKENGRTLDINTEKGRANEAALDAIASSAGEVLQGMIESKKPYDEVSAALGRQREALVKAATSFGMTKAEAEAYATSVLQIPDKATTTIETRGMTTGKEQADALRRAIENIPSFKGVTVRYDEVLGTTMRRPGGGKIVERADGGWVPGNGGSRADDQIIAASSGEFVVNARSAAQHAQLLEAVNSNRFADGGWVGGRSFGFPGGGGAGGSAPVVHWKTEIYGTDDIVGRAVGQQARELAFNLATTG